MWVLKSTESREEKNVGESERIEGWKKWWKRNWEKGWKPFFRCVNRFMVFSLGFFSDVFFPIGFLWAVFFQCIGIFMGISMLSYSLYFEVKKLSGWFFFYSHLFLLRVIALKFTIDFNATHPVILWCSA